MEFTTKSTKDTKNGTRFKIDGEGQKESFAKGQGTKRTAGILRW